MDTQDRNAVARIINTLDARLRGILDANDGVARVRCCSEHAGGVIVYLEAHGYTVGSRRDELLMRDTIEIERRS